MQQREARAGRQPETGGAARGRQSDEKGKTSRRGVGRAAGESPPPTAAAAGEGGRGSAGADKEDGVAAAPEAAAAGSEAAAERFYRARLERYPDDAENARRYALWLLAAGRAEEGEVVFRVAVAHGLRAPALLCDYAALLAQRGRAGKAQELLRAALARDPTCAEALRALALIHLQQGASPAPRASAPAAPAPLTRARRRRRGRRIRRCRGALRAAAHGARTLSGPARPRGGGARARARARPALPTCARR
jgi:tetratricopeptide (TPR) repeat protein